MNQTHPIGTVCYEWISGPFMTFKGEIIEQIFSKVCNSIFYKVKFFDTRFDIYYTTLVCSIYLTVEEARKAHDEMEKVFEKNKMFEE